MLKDEDQLGLSNMQVWGQIGRITLETGNIYLLQLNIRLCCEPSSPTPGWEVSTCVHLFPAGAKNWR